MPLEGRWWKRWIHLCLVPEAGQVDQCSLLIYCNRGNEQTSSCINDKLLVLRPVFLRRQAALMVQTTVCGFNGERTGDAH